VSTPPFQEDPLVLNEYRDDLRIECEKFGEVKKVIIFDVGHQAGGVRPGHLNIVLR